MQACASPVGAGDAGGAGGASSAEGAVGGIFEMVKLQNPNKKKLAKKQI